MGDWAEREVTLAEKNGIVRWGGARAVSQKEANMRTFILLLGLAMACGGDAQPAPEPAPQNTAGNDQATEPEPYEEEIEAAPEPTGPGRIHALIRMRSEDQAGTVSVRSLSGEVVAEGTAGETLEVPSGEYRVHAMMDPSILPGHVEMDERIFVQPGETSELSFTYEVARIRLNVRRGGRALNSWRMVVTREGGDTEVTLQPSSEHVDIAPGRYGGVLTAGGSRIEVNGLIFQGGATMDVPVNVN